MNTHGLPNDVLSNLDPFALVSWTGRKPFRRERSDSDSATTRQQIILLPVLDLLVYPFFRKIGFNFSPLRRVFAGFIFG